MENPIKSASSLPSMQHLFEIDVKGEDSGQTFRGEFVYKRPSLGVKTKIDIEFAKLKKGATDLNADTNLLLYMIAFLKNTIVEAPKWFLDSNGGLDLYDAEVVTCIYLKTVEFEAEWRKSVFGEKNP